MSCEFPDCEEKVESTGFCGIHFKRASDLGFLPWLDVKFASAHPFLYAHWKKQNGQELAREWLRVTAGVKE